MATIVETTSPIQQQYFSVKDAASILNVDTITVRRMIYSKRLEAYKVGRVIRIPWAALIAALEPAVA